MTPTPDRAAPDDDFGHLERAGERPVLHFTRYLAHQPEKVWRALTEPEHLAAWFPTTIEGDRAAGATLRFSFPQGEAEPFAGRMIACEPPRLMELAWGDDVLRFELEPHDGGCLLRFSDTLAELGKAARDGAGWHACLDRLALAVAGTTPPWSATERWSEVHDGYVARLGPEASTIGPPGES
jgi:uncharacterized protein YndB with AHSA1/START domain